MSVLVNSLFIVLTHILARSRNSELVKADDFQQARVEHCQYSLLDPKDYISCVAPVQADAVFQCSRFCLFTPGIMVSGTQAWT